MSNIKRRVMTEILAGKNPVWIETDTPKKFKVDGHFLAKGNMTCIYKVTKRNATNIANYSQYYLEWDLVQHMINEWNQYKLAYFIIWSTGNPREYGYYAFDLWKYMEKHNNQPEILSRTMNQFTQWGDGKKISKNVIAFDYFDIVKEGFVIIPKESNQPKQELWNPQK